MKISFPCLSRAWLQSLARVLVKGIFPLERRVVFFQKKFDSKAFSEIQGRAEKTKCSENYIPMNVCP